MKSLYTKKPVIAFFLAFTLALLAQAQTSSVYFDLDACNATIITGDNMDYSEFTGQIDNNGSCANLEVVGGHLYRNNPAANKHSCTPGVNGDPAMCIGSHPACSFTPGADEALRIDLMVTPGNNGNAVLSELSFYEQGPPVYDWINGPSGPNNYPTLFSVRILKNGVEIFLAVDIPTALAWNLNTFNFSGMPEFTVTEPTVFNIQLLPYCPVGNGADVSAWDIDEIRILADCCDAPSGGLLSGGPFEFCVGDGIPDHVSGIVLTGQTGANSQWVITDASNNILSLPSSPDSVNFDGGGQGICLIWHVSYDAGLSGLLVGNNLLTDLNGCFGLSNSITVIRNQPEGGALTGGPFEFCVGDSITDVTGILLSGNVGPNSQLVVTNNLNTILNMPGSLVEVDFSGSGPGTFFILNVSFFDTLSGFVIGNNLFSDVTGCFAVSNAITVVLNQPAGGVLSGGPFEFCVGDSIPDYVSGVVLSGNVGANSQWVVTNDSSTILSLPASIDSVNFDGGGPGICLIWHVSYFDSLTGLVPGNNLLTDISGCFALSNSITVIRNQPQGGALTGGPFEFCLGDSITDVTSILLSGNVGTTSQLVVTNDLNTIISMPGSLEVVNFQGIGPGTFFIVNVSFFDTLSGFVIGNNLLSDVTGCFALSNPITVELNQAAGGVLAGGPFEFCVGDGIPDHVSGIVLSGNVGDNSQWVVTNDVNEILSLPSSIDSVNFDGGGPGICLIWHVSYFDSISGLIPGNNLLADVTGCFAISNSITVIRTQPEGGILAGGPYEFCVGDGIPDHVTGISLSGDVGDNSQWVVTNDENVILSLPGTPIIVDFDGGGPGICLIWHVSYFDSLSGLVPGNNLLTEVTGCFALSNPITVNRNQPEGGELSGGPFEFCVGDGIPDHVSGIVLSGNAGDNSQWVVTNDVNEILSLPASIDSVNFDGGGPGICLIWHVSYFDSLSGLVAGNDLLTDLDGCFALSNSITVIRNQPEGGELTGGPFEFCVGDTIPDHVSGIELLGNSGANSQFVVTDSLNNILSLPATPEEVDFNQAEPGLCYIWHVSYDGILVGLEPGNNLLTDLEGCFSLSNSIAVVRLDCEGFHNGDPVFEMRIFPNPVRGIMNLKMLYSGEEKPLVRVFDASGRLCFEKDHELGSDMTIDMGHMSEGMYFIRVQSPLGYKTESIVLIK